MFKYQFILHSYQNQTMSNRHVVHHACYNKVGTNTVVIIIIICLFSYPFLSKQELTARPFLTFMLKYREWLPCDKPMFSTTKDEISKKATNCSYLEFSHWLAELLSTITMVAGLGLGPHLFIEWKIYTVRNRLMLYISYGKSTNNRYRADSLRWELLCDQTTDSILKSFMKFIQWKGNTGRKTDPNAGFLVLHIYE